MSNLEPLRKALKWAKMEALQPESHWNQNLWVGTEDYEGEEACGTTMCLAGKIVWDAGLVKQVRKGSNEFIVDTKKAVKAYPQLMPYAQNGDYVGFAETAEAILDVPFDSLGGLWHTMTDDPNMIEVAAKQIVADELGEDL